MVGHVNDVVRAGNVFHGARVRRLRVGDLRAALQRIHLRGAPLIIKVKAVHCTRGRGTGSQHKELVEVQSVQWRVLHLVKCDVQDRLA